MDNRYIRISGNILSETKNLQSKGYLDPKLIR